MAGYYFEALETVEKTEVIYEGKMGECIAVREIDRGERYGNNRGKKGISSCA